MLVYLYKIRPNWIILVEMPLEMCRRLFLFHIEFSSILKAIETNKNYWILSNIRKIWYILQNQFYFVTTLVTGWMIRKKFSSIIHNFLLIVLCYTKKLIYAQTSDLNFSIISHSSSPLSWIDIDNKVEIYSKLSINMCFILRKRPLLW